jgi:hypothetical protein
LLATVGGAFRKRATAFKSVFVESYTPSGTEYGRTWRSRGVDQVKAPENIKKSSFMDIAMHTASMATFL